MKENISIWLKSIGSMHRLLSYLLPGPKSYNRSSLLDGLRGFAIVLMVIFHFCYDLTLFGLASIPIYTDLGWIAFRYTIVSLFLGTVGVSLYLHSKRGINWFSYWRRLALLIMASIAITLTSFLALNEGYILFGILHLITLSSVLGLVFVRLFWLNLLLGVSIIWLGFNYGNSFFNQDWLLWVGLRTLATGAADYTPIFPWFGVVLIGMFVAQLLEKRLYYRLPDYLGFLVLWGRHSLIIYLLHQPILWGLLAIYIAIIS